MVRLAASLGKRLCWAALCCCLLQCASSSNGFNGEVRVGILHSLTGTMAISEQTVVNAEMMAISELNAAGGLLGREIKPIIEDGESDWDVFAAKAENFTSATSANYVEVVFGCWTSASRKSVLPVFERNNHMLFYPVQYEGQECSKNIFYTGATPNQQIEPAVDWLLRYKSDNFFLVGSDYVFPRTANEIIRNQLAALGGSTVGEMYLPLGERSNSSVGAVIEEIQRTMPNGGVIFNTLNGDSNVQFFHMFYDAGLRPDRYPIMSVSITETEIDVIGVQYLVGHYAAWNFFMSIKDTQPCPNSFDPTQAIGFVERYQAMYGSDSLVNDPMEAAYIGVLLWAKAVELAGTFDRQQVRNTIIGMAVGAPEGEVTMQANHHITKFVRLGQVTASGDFAIIYESTRAVMPEPWNTWVPSSSGYACDWSDASKGSFYQLPAVHVALVHKLTGADAYAERKFLEAEIATIRQVNREGGVNGKTIMFTVHDVGENGDWPGTTVRSLASDPSPSRPVVIFGTAPTDAEYDSAMQGLPSGFAAPLLVNPLFLTGGECSAQVVHVGGSLKQRLQPSLEQFVARSKAAQQPEARFYIVGRLSDAAMAAVEQHVKDVGGVVRGLAMPVTMTDIRGLPATILERMPEGGTIVNLLSDVSEVIELFDALIADNMGAGRFPLILTNFAETQLTRVGDRIRSHWVVSSYFKAEESTQNTIFLDSIAQAYGRDYPVNEFVASAYLGVRYWASAAMLAGEFGSRAVQREMWSQDITTLDGLLKLDASGFLPRSFKLGVTNEGLDAFRIFQAQTVPAVDPDPSWIYPELAGSCDFSRSLQLVCQAGQGLVSENGSFVSAVEDAFTCDWCPQGFYSDLLPRDGDLPTRLCRLCQPGTKQGTPGQLACDDCSAGAFSDGPGMTACTLCDIGRYQDEIGKSVCKDCEVPMTTRLFGAALLSACGCPAGMYFNHPCRICTEGMECTDFNQTMPTQLPGWYIENNSVANYPVWRCRTNEECRRGPPGTCARNRADVPACADCRDGYTNSRKGECEKCKADIATFMAPVLVIVGTCGLVVVHVAVNFPRAKTSAKSMSAGILGGLAVNAVLNFNVYQGASEFWESPLADFFGALAILKFDLQGMKFSCIVGSNNEVLRYAGECVTPIVAFVCMLLGTVIGKMVLCGSLSSYIRLCRTAYINTYGGILSVFFISVSMITFSPFKCVTHPNGISSLESNRAIRCWSPEDGHDGMVATALLAILVYPVTFLSATGWCTYVYHAKLAKGGAQFLERTRFLFNRFKPTCYIFGFWFNLRSMLLALTPVVFAGSFGIKMFSFMIIFTAWFWTQMKFEPWRFGLCNLFDSFLAPIQLMTILCFALLGPQMSDDNKVDIEDLGILVICLCLLSIVALGLAGCMKLAERFRGKKFFTYFLSHHKAAAGVFARQVKMMLEELGGSSSTRIFLDVDNLENLDSLVFTVSSNVENMIVLLSSETLKRFWCAVEVVISHMNKVNTVLMKIEDNALEAAEEVMESIAPLWTEKEWGEFLECGVQSVQEVETAYTALLGRSAMHLLKHASASKQVSGVESMLRACRNLPRNLRTLSTTLDVGKECWIIYDTQAETQYCVSRILEILMVRSGWTTFLMDSDSGSCLPNFDSTSVFFLMLSNGIFQNPVSAGLLTLVSKVGMLVVPILNQPDYVRPSPAFLNSVVAGEAYDPAQQVILWKAARGCSNKDICEAFTSISKKIALKFSPEANQDMMKLEFSRILARTNGTPEVVWLADV